MRNFLVIIALLLCASTVKALDDKEISKAFEEARKTCRANWGVTTSRNPSSSDSLVADPVAAAFEFERMKQRSDYPNDLSKVTRVGQLFILWVGYENPTLYAWFKDKIPDAVHAYSSGLDVSQGLVIGIKRANMVESVREVGSFTLSDPKTKEVILKLASDRPAVEVADRPFVSTQPIGVQTVGSTSIQIPTSNRGEGQLFTPTRTLVPSAGYLGGTTTPSNYIRCVGYK